MTKTGAAGPSHVALQPLPPAPPWPRRPSPQRCCPISSTSAWRPMLFAVSSAAITPPFTPWLRGTASSSSLLLEQSGCKLLFAATAAMPLWSLSPVAECWWFSLDTTASGCNPSLTPRFLQTFLELSKPAHASPPSSPHIEPPLRCAQTSTAGTCSQLPASCNSLIHLTFSLRTRLLPCVVTTCLYGYPFLCHRRRGSKPATPNPCHWAARKRRCRRP